jgi:AraC-like DNA-binding protein
MAGPAPLVIDSEVARLWIAACRLTTDLRQVQRASGSSASGSSTSGSSTSGSSTSGSGTVADSRSTDHGDIHTVPTLVVCLEGVARVTLPRRNLDVLPGAAVLVPPGVRHQHATLRRGSAQLALGFMLGRCDIELATGSRTWWLTIPEQPARNLLEQACHRPVGDLLELTRRALEGLSGTSATPVAPMPEPVERMWACLRRDRLSPISAETVLRASGLGVTRAHLLFRTWFGETPHRLLQRHRLDYARHLLAEGGAVGEVATTCGFRTRRQFTTAFKAATGVAPSAWSSG